MPSAPIGSVWAAGSWSDTAWEAGTWADAVAGGGAATGSRYRYGYRYAWAGGLVLFIGGVAWLV